MRKIKQKKQSTLTRWICCCSWRCESSRRVLKIRDQVAGAFFCIFVFVEAFFFAWPKVPGLKVGHVDVVIIIIWCCVSAHLIGGAACLARRRGRCEEGRGEVRGCVGRFRCLGEAIVLGAGEVGAHCCRLLSSMVGL